MERANASDLDELLCEHKARVGRVVMEVLSDVFHRMPFGQQIALADGRTATIKPFTQPNNGSEREDELRDTPHAGFDVVFDDGSGHVEFSIRQSGWGASV